MQCGMLQESTGKREREGGREREWGGGCLHCNTQELSQNQTRTNLFGMVSFLLQAEEHRGEGLRAGKGKREREVGLQSALAHPAPSRREGRGERTRGDPHQGTWAG